MEGGREGERVSYMFLFFFCFVFFISFFSIALSKMDILDTFEEIKIGVGYKLHGVELDSMPGAYVRRKKTTKKRCRVAVETLLWFKQGGAFGPIGAS